MTIQVPNEVVTLGLPPHPMATGHMLTSVSLKVSALTAQPLLLPFLASAPIALLVASAVPIMSLVPLNVLFPRHPIPAGFLTSSAHVPGPPAMDKAGRTVLAVLASEAILPSLKCTLDPPSLFRVSATPPLAVLVSNPVNLVPTTLAMLSRIPPVPFDLMATLLEHPPDLQVNVRDAVAPAALAILKLGWPVYAVPPAL